jgi:LAO/AO transport system kinase
MTALKSLSGRHDTGPVVLTCSAREGRGIDAVWDAIESRHQQFQTSGELIARRRRQSLRWLWSIVADRLRQSVQTHPEVLAIRDELEREVLDGTLPPEAAARRILEAFGAP